NATERRSQLLLCDIRSRTGSFPRRREASHVQVVRGHEAGMFLNEGEAKLGLAPHEFFHPLLCKVPFASVLVQVGGRLHDDAQEGPLCRIHRRFLELLWRHFTKALEAADLDLAFAAEAL